MTELMHNALEHGLAEKGTTLGIEVSTSEKVMKVIVSDDGAGFPADFDIQTSPNLGLQIVRTLTENELRGQLHFTSAPSKTRVFVTFPL